MDSAAQQIEARLAQLAIQGADARQIARAAIQTWRAIDAALSPIVGPRGVAALYRRSLYLTHRDHPSLTSVAEGAREPGDFDSLQAALAQQTSANAAAANGALLHAFTTLLASLIGAALAERLLLSALDHPSSGHAVPETTP